MRGIYLVANNHSEAHCANLVYSIRQSGCRLPIRLIPFGGKSVRSQQILSEVEVVELGSFSAEAHGFIGELKSVLTQCPTGFLHRFLAWFGDWDEFLYSDNDVVALMNWERLFDFLPGFDVVHADTEYTTKGRFNYQAPTEVEAIFGDGALLSAFTAGHFLSRRDERLVADMRHAIEWFRAHPRVPVKHDQALLHVASLLGRWKMLNLCREPHHWLSSWAGDYQNPLALLQALQGSPACAGSHLHFSGGTPSGAEPIHDFLTANLTSDRRKRYLFCKCISSLSGWRLTSDWCARIRRGIIRRWRAWRAHDNSDSP
jgi:hypothetical protein